MNLKKKIKNAVARGKNAESALDSAKSQNLVKKSNKKSLLKFLLRFAFAKRIVPPNLADFNPPSKADSQNLDKKPCHSERSEESKKNNLVILSEAKYLKNNIRDSSLRKCSAQNDKIKAENDNLGVRVAESSLKVGIVIPIYNVASYLRECLDSVLNQSYKNFHAVLVNDGSTDNSKEIALEYVAKDSRFTLIDKENGGLSSARNAGIKYFSQSAESSLDSAIIHSHKNTILNPKIDYIIFLDSDDFWENNLLETCGKVAESRLDSANSQNPSVIWFGFKPTKNGAKLDPLDAFGFKDIATISPQEWVQRAQQVGIGQFWFSWGGMIDFRFLREKKLQFLEGALYEDELFGLQIFSQSRAICVLPKKLYHYRIRDNSIASSAKKRSLPPFLTHLRAHFSDENLAWEYACASSFARILAQSVALFDNLSDKALAEALKRAFLPTLFARSCDILGFRHDPYLMKARVVRTLKENGHYLSALKIIAKIPHKRARYAMFLSYFAPKLVWGRIKRRIKLLFVADNSVLGMQFRTCGNFGESTDYSLVLSPKFSQIQKPHRNHFDCDSLCKSTANQMKNAESTLDSANSQNLVKNNPRVSANLETRPLRGAKNRNQGCRSATADFLLEAEKRGSPPKSEKRQLLARRGSGEGGAALLRKESSEISSKGIAESKRDSSPTAHNDKIIDCHADSANLFAMTENKKIAESALYSAKLGDLRG